LHTGILGDGCTGLVRPSSGLDKFFAAQFLAGYITNMFGFDLRQAHQFYAAGNWVATEVFVFSVQLIFKISKIIIELG
jgi:hypothetical protein